MRLDCNIYFLFKKQAFNGLLKVIGIQILFLMTFNKSLRYIFTFMTFSNLFVIKSRKEKQLTDSKFKANKSDSFTGSNIYSANNTST